MKSLISILIVLALVIPTAAFTETITKTNRDVANHLQEISVTIRADGQYSTSEGSGVLISREIDGENVTFVWTCGHVLDHLRKVRTVIKEGVPVKVVEFEDVQIIKELIEEGRRVGEIKMDAKVLKYSDPDDGEDLALLMVRAKDYAKDSADFYLDKSDYNIVPIGTGLYHVGSLLGQRGSNSMTSGIVSQVGRIYGKVEYDQTTVTAFPGSSGGGVYLRDGRYMGMLVRGAGENFNLIVPVRRMYRWAEEHNILWALDTSLNTPTMKEINNLPVETTGDVDIKVKSKKTTRKNITTGLREMIRVIPHENRISIDEMVHDDETQIQIKLK